MVLTKFIRNEAESRPYWPRGGIPRGAHQGGACKAPTGPGGWVGGRTGTLCRHPPTPALIGLPGPAPLVSAPLYSVRPWRLGVPRYYPPWYTHPVPIPTAVRRRCHAAGTRCTPRNTRFWHVVGEPRGVEYSGISRPWNLEAWIYTTGLIHGPWRLLITKYD